MYSIRHISPLLTVVLLCLHGAELNQEDIGSGDDFSDNEAPDVKWNEPRGPDTAWNTPTGGKIIHGSDSNWRPENAWNGQPSDNDWDIDESGDGQDIVRTLPGLEAPVQPALPSDKEDDDNEGGNGIIMNPGNPDDTAKLCATPDYCENDGICYYDVHEMKSVCECARGFTGERCERENLIVPPDDSDVDDDDDNRAEVKRQRSLLIDIVSHPIAIAVVAVSGVLFIGLLVTMLICCCRCIRKKDEGSYTLDAALLNNKVEYTKVPNSQEFYA